jgi:hypothetical protein
MALSPEPVKEERMSKPKVPRNAPMKNWLVHLTRVQIRRVEDFSGKPIPRKQQTEMSVDDVALALDFLERINWRRTREEKAAWIDSQVISDRLHALRGLIHLRQELVDRHALAVSEEDWDAFIADLLEYFTIRAELAGETTIPRERRYAVIVDERALGLVPAGKAAA